MKSRTNIHHRLPRSLGGHDGGKNIISVCRRNHNLWHLIFGNMHALQIKEQIVKHFLPNPEIVLSCTVEDPGKIIYGGNHACRMSVRHQAWDSLFFTMDEDRILAYINNVWLDPNFVLLTPKNEEWWNA